MASTRALAISTSLARASNEEGFRTTGTDAYPQRLDEALAASSSKEGKGEKRIKVAGESGKVDIPEKKANIAVDTL